VKTGLAVAFIVLAAAALAAQDTQRFRAGVELVSLTVTVTQGSKYVTDLEEADFEVFEDGVRQDLTFFTRLQQPISLAILIDTSNSMENSLRTAQDAAIGFVRRMRPDDVMEVIEFNSQVKIAQEYTSDVEALERAIRQTSVSGATSLYNAIYIALRGLRRQKAQTSEDIRRQAIVVLSDGDDTTSLVPYEEVLDLAKRSETAIYSIGLREPDQGRPRFREAEFVLGQLAQETGGRAFFPTHANELSRIYTQISEELASQYSLAYTSRNRMRNGAWRRIQVRVARPGVQARTRQGYFAPTTTQ
jgi:Ca-activated chloride channel homolog